MLCQYVARIGSDLTQSTVSNKNNQIGMLESQEILPTAQQTHLADLLI